MRYPNDEGQQPSFVDTRAESYLQKHERNASAQGPTPKMD